MTWVSIVKVLEKYLETEKNLETVERTNKVVRRTLAVYCSIAYEKVHMRSSCDSMTMTTTGIGSSILRFYLCT